MRFCVVLLLAVGCGPASSDGNDASGTDDGSVGDGAAPDGNADLSAGLGDGGSTPDGMGGGADLAGGVVTDTNGKRGGVTLYSNDYTLGATHYLNGSANAGFNVISGAYVETCPSATQFGDCLLLDGCSTSGGTGTYTPESAGTITITGAATSPITLTPNGSNAYAPFAVMSSTLWSGGETLAISAAGGTVPAFSTSIVAPAAFSLTAPTVTAGALTISLSSDSVITWTGGGGTVHLILELSPNKIPRLDCTFPASTGSGTISKAALAGVISGTTGTFALGVSELKTFAVSDWTVSVSATVPPTQGGQYLGVTNVTFQ
jgi:hypothetical protein